MRKLQCARGRCGSPTERTRPRASQTATLFLFHLSSRGVLSMKPVSDDVLIRQLRWRYATKKFDAARKIAAADWQTLEQALLYAPSSYGLQPWHFIVVTDPAVREKLRPVSWNQPQITDASHLVVFAIKRNL